MREMTELDFEQLLTLIISGKSVTKACGELGYTSAAPLWFYIDREPDGGETRRDRYYAARRFAADAQFDAIQDMEELVVDNEMAPAALSAVVNSRKWRLSKMNPSVYADVSTLDVRSSDRTMSPSFNALSMEELEKIMQKLG